MVLRSSRGRVVSVRYRICVYADVDLDTGEVVRVLEDDETVRLDLEPIDAGITGDVALRLVDEAYQPSGRAYPVEITPEVAHDAITAAERAVWPEWQRA